MKQERSIIISITSDIGEALAYDWKDSGDQILGTYRSKDQNYNNLTNMGLDLKYLDLLDKESIKETVEYISQNYNNWDKLVLCPASQEPIGRFENTDFDKWEESININFTSQMRILHALLPLRNKTSTPSVILFAGGGTNNATLNYSAYTISKIATIKMTELLDKEIDDVKFIIYGPGWVKTKIHNSTIEFAEEAEDSYDETIRKLNSDECTSYEDIISSINWGVSCDKQSVGGRNISVVYDQWGTEKLEDQLKKDKNMYKLRRSGNDWK